MSFEDYKDALKQGQKAYRKAVTEGRYPYLSVLDDIISYTNIESEMNLGVVEIPIKMIVGTKTAGRTNSFAGNFMPLLSEESEFAAKWINLDRALQEEGLRDPIKCYEYLNYYYVMEGNKRVSVMKYLGAASIPGIVIRVLPKRTNTYENKLYYEYFDFYQSTKINYLTFTKLGSYKQLQKLIGKQPGDEWTDDDKMYFKSVYTRFEKAYEGKAGNHKPMATSDALLVYLTIYPYDQIRDDLIPQFKVNLDKSWEEFLVHKDDQMIELSMVPQLKKTDVLSKILNVTETVAEAPIKMLTGSENTKKATTVTETTKKLMDAPKLPKKKTGLHIAFIHDKTSKTSGWTYGHELGRLHLEQKFAGKLTTSSYDNVDPMNLKMAYETIEKAIKDGNNVIFTTTPKLLNASLKVAVNYPNVKILNCSLNSSHPSIRTYYGRMYEAKFLVGAIAGALSGTDTIGYIADYPIYGETANINAFALGVKMVNPRARIVLEWSTVKDRDIHENLKKNGACFISDRDIIVPDHASRQFGLYYEDTAHHENAEPENMAMPVWHWGRFYELLVRSITSGSWKDYEPSGKVKALNFWWGMSAGVIDVILSKNMPEGTRRLINLLKTEIATGDFHPFSGMIKDQDGHVRHDSERPMSPEEIIKMDWLIEGIEGYIPSPEELTDEARQIVDVQGVKK